MPFIFPQIAGLGLSPIAIRYAIESRGEALAYLNDPALGDRLRDMTNLVIHSPASPANELFGSSDELALCASMTLFDAIAPQDRGFARAIDRWFTGPDSRTLQILRSLD